MTTTVYKIIIIIIPHILTINILKHQLHLVHLDHLLKMPETSSIIIIIFRKIKLI